MYSPSNPQPTQDFESIWAEIKLSLEWQHGFGFYLVLSDDPRSARQLRQRVEDATRLRTRLLQWVCPQNPETAVQEALHAAFPTGEARRFHDWQAPLWLELTTAPGDAAWDQARRATLSALNRRRSALEQQCPRPLFIQLPSSFAPEIVTWAPDLWSVRQFVAVLTPV
ncbi:hypothetical protein [Zoogloea sp.]|uniref:hypothetical protein n=1 Tax=Zoogloea sp. TaxID=49181 RepID=UPI0035B34EA3